MKVIELTAENVKRLRAVDITPDPHLQVVAGRNAQGKTSVLDAIWLALGGGPASRETPRPIRDGEDHASVRLDLGDMVVTRTWSGGKTNLLVQSAAGAKYSSPQGVLDGLVGRLAFDPLEFTRLSAREQTTALLDLVDLEVDLDALAAERADTYEQRTEIGREVKSMEGQLDGLGEPEEAPDAQVSVTDLFATYQAGEAAHRAHRELVDRAEFLEVQVTSLRVELEQAEADLNQAQIALDNAVALPDLDALREDLDGADLTNQAVRRNAERRTVAHRLDLARSAYTAATDSIDQIDQERTSALALAQFPVPGLGFDDDGVTYHGIPFGQASSSEQIRVSLAMAMALNPTLRVIRILDGSLLDDANLALIEEMARDRDFQVWIERVGTSDGLGVVIEDGQVA